MKTPPKQIKFEGLIFDYYEYRSKSKFRVMYKSKWRKNPLFYSENVEVLLEKLNESVKLKNIEIIYAKS